MHFRRRRHRVITRGSRAAGVVVLAACATVLAAPDAIAAATGTNPAEQLWRAYPLEQTTTTSGQPAAPPAPSTTGGSSETSGRASGDGTPWLVLVLAAAAIGSVAALAVVGLRRRGRRPRPSPSVVSAPPAAATAVEDRAPPVAAAAPAPRAIDANGAAPRPSGASKAARGPICQIRWLPKGRGSCFAAVTPDADGAERTLATSPPVQWRAATPPEQSPEAQAALRQLSKTLRDGGWRPMRTKGKDFNEPQWYARRFRLPEPAAEGEGPDASTPGEPRAAAGRTRQAASRSR